MIERISLNSLKFFYFVAKYGSVTLAAKKLFVTQSAVSKQIYNLEEALNTTLFERKKQNTCDDGAGRNFIELLPSSFWSTR
ncbi:LysR family transcriptional regulator [Acinetobacter pittii]|nr:LysR family transcriptional regulator [Acinetobacter pittii]